MQTDASRRSTRGVIGATFGRITARHALILQKDQVRRRHDIFDADDLLPVESTSGAMASAVHNERNAYLASPMASDVNMTQASTINCRYSVNGTRLSASSTRRANLISS